MFPYPYSQDQTSVFLGLINNSNPGLQVAPLTAAQLRTIVPTAITPVPPAIQDTSTRLMIKQGTRYVGSQTVTYRRINLANLFRGINVDGNGVTTLILQQYQAANTLTPTQIAAELNATYGLQLTAADLAGTGTVTSTTIGVVGTSVSLVIASTSLCYAPGTTNVKLAWLRPKVPLSSVISGSPSLLVGRKYPGGNTFPTDGSRKPQGDYFLYGYDASSLSSQIGALAVSGTNADFTATAWSTILSAMQKARADLNFSSAASSTTGGLSGVSWQRLAIPSASAPAANAIQFQNVLVLTAVAGSWFQGSIYLHYGLLSSPGTQYLSSADSIYLSATDDQQAMLVGAGATGIGVKDATTGYVVTGQRATVAGDNVTQNTKWRITAQPGNPTYQGYQDVFVDRLDLGAFSNFSPYQLTIPSGDSILAHLDIVRNQYGIQLTANDINDATTGPNSDGSQVVVTITAKSTSYGWTGTTTLSFAGSPPISQAFASNQLAGF